MTASVLLPELLRQAAERDADHSALVMEGRSVSYAALHSLSNQVARSLLRQGVRREDRVALWLDKSIEAIAAIWGVLKAGAAYVPIDDGAPAQRMAAIARDCSVAALVTSTGRAAQIEHAFSDTASMRAIWLVDSVRPGRRAALPTIAWGDLAKESPEAPPVATDADDLASIQYTSGSTGEPKGVMLTHRALFDQAVWTSVAFGLTREDRLPGCTPIQSAMSTFEIFAATASGATTYLVPKRVAAFPAALAKIFSEQRLTACYIIPSALMLMLSRGNLAQLDLSSLRMIAFAGETLPFPRLCELMELLPYVRFVQVYSRTEVKMRSFHEVKFPPREIDTRTIGLIPPGFRIFVLDERQGVVNEGSVGEMWIAGPGLMRGYWEQPELTSEVIQTIALRAPEQVLACRTGDLVRRLADGTLEMVGRADQQVKIRGYRVETGEIERVLHQHPAVARAVVIAEEDMAVGHHLRAIVVRKSGAALGTRELREHCFSVLPRYMIPEVFEFRAQMPLSGNGKVDRRALAKPPVQLRRTPDDE
jgi:amino acid adenylation domain-containing protein